MRTIEEIKQYYEALREAFRNTNSSDEWVGQPIKEMWMILDHIAELQAQNAALRARVDALGEWQGVEVVPMENIERCLLRQTEHGYKSYCFGGFQVRGGWHYFAQYGDGSEYPQALDNSVGVWEWRPLPDESPTAAESEDEDCPVCGGTGWIQEGWGEYHMDGIPCGACAYDEEEGVKQRGWSVPPSFSSSELSATIADARG